MSAIRTVWDCVALVVTSLAENAADYISYSWESIIDGSKGRQGGVMKNLIKGGSRGYVKGQGINLSNYLATPSSSMRRTII